MSGDSVFEDSKREIQICLRTCATTPGYVGFTAASDVKFPKISSAYISKR